MISRAKYTGGNRKKASYDTVMSWLQYSLGQLRMETLMTSFECCGIHHRRYKEFFNTRLKTILEGSNNQDPLYAEPCWDDLDVQVEITSPQSDVDIVYSDNVDSEIERFNDILFLYSDIENDSDE